MSKAIMDTIKKETTKLDPAETAVLTGWLMKQVKMDVPHGDGCPHYNKKAKECRYPDVVSELRKSP